MIELAWTVFIEGHLASCRILPRTKFAPHMVDVVAKSLIAAAVASITALFALVQVYHSHRFARTLCLHPNLQVALDVLL